MIFKTFIFISLLVSGISSSLLAEDKVDYNKPFPEIKEQVSAFDTRHSLMPVEEKNESVNKTSVENTPSLEVSNNLNVDELSKVNTADVSNQNPNVKVNVENVDDFKTVIISGKDNEEKNIVGGNKTFELREEHLPVVLKPTPLKTEDVQPIANITPYRTDVPAVNSVKMDVVENKNAVQPIANIIPYRTDVPAVNPVKMDVVENKNAVQPIANIIPYRTDVPVANPMKVDVVENKVEVKPVVLKPLPLKTEEVKPVADVSSYRMDVPVANPVKMDVVENKENEKSFAHVASYTTEESARNGFKLLEKKYPQFNIFEPSVKYENVPNKGWFYRLYLVGDKRELSMLCKDMMQNGDWCLLKQD